MIRAVVANMTRRKGRLYPGTSAVAVCILLGGSPLAVGRIQVGVGIAAPGVSIGFNIPAYPQLIPIAGYPVYYAPGVSANLFFYDGLYWAFAGDNWYYSSWYDGPWSLAEPELVPDFILRVPILYYRSPPPYFLRWNRTAPPRWGEHWGRGWQEHRRGWDRWDRASVPPRAPLPGYQRQYPRGRYPGTDEQRNLENRYYHYRPRDPGDRRRAGTPPEAHRVPPGAMQRPPAFARPSPPARVERRSPDANRPGSRAGARPAQPRNDSRAPGRQEQRKKPRSRDDVGDGQPPWLGQEGAHAPGHGGIRAVHPGSG